jgi:hypothetical protein
MSIVNIEPSVNHPLPYDLDDQKPATFMEELIVAANTVDLQQSLGLEIGLNMEDADKEKRLFADVLKHKKTKNLTSQNTAFAASAFLSTYGQSLALDAAKARAAITNKLMEIANCGDPKYELKALELLGKHVDIALFSERSEVTVNYKNPEDLEREIKERVKRLLNADVIDVLPISDNLDEELGIIELPPKVIVEESIEDLFFDKEPARLVVPWGDAG